MDQIGPYQILDAIGEGGMSVVYRAIQPALNRVVALKVLLPQLQADKVFVRRFQQEAEIAARLAHENIVRIWDAQAGEAPYYIVMEYLAGGSLADRLRGGPLPADEAVYIARQLCGALDYAHRQEIVHRDLKPENVMFDARNRPILTDFGIARSTQYAGLTSDGARLGTPDYMAPEQARGMRADHRSDLYALAAVLYEMLTGCPPFSGGNAIAIMRRIVAEEVPPPSTLNASVPPALDAILLRALAKEPDLRFQSGTEFSQALSFTFSPPAAPGPFIPVSARCEVSSTAERRSGEAQSGARRLRPELVAVFAVLLTLAAVCLVLPPLRLIALVVILAGPIAVLAVWLRSSRHPAILQPLAWLQVYEPGAPPCNVPLGRPAVTIGRDPANSLILHDPRVSARHAEILAGADGASVRDLGSTNGTWVNDDRVSEFVLRNGDRIRLGDTILIFLLPTPG